MTGLSGAARLQEEKAMAVRVPNGLECSMLPYTIAALACEMRAKQYVESGRTRAHLCAGEGCEHFRPKWASGAGTDDPSQKEPGMRKKAQQREDPEICGCGKPKGAGSKRCLRCQGRYANSRRHPKREEQALGAAGKVLDAGAAVGGLVTAERAQEAIRGVCRDLAEMLVRTNRAYGNSALDPVRVFSKAGAAEQIRVRLDDKLSRLIRGEAAGEDAEWDLMGYLVLLRVAKGMGAGAAP